MDTIDWNGTDLPEGLRGLPPGRYLVASLDHLPPPPVDLAVVPPPEALPERIRALSGAWEGRWERGRRLRLVVERLSDTEATVVYAITASTNSLGWCERYTARVSADGMLTIGLRSVWGVFVLSADLSFLRGVHCRSGSRTVLRRASTSS